MGISFVQPPADVTLELQTQVSRALSYRVARQELLGDDPADNLSVSRLHRIYSFPDTLDFANDWLTQAQPAGWRGLFRRAEKVVFAYQTQDGKARGVLTHGPLVSGTITALERSASADWFQQRDYELRLLLCTPLNVAFLWLTHPEVDYLVPLRTDMNGLVFGQAYAPDQVTQQLSEIRDQRTSLRLHGQEPY